MDIATLEAEVKEKSSNGSTLKSGFPTVRPIDGAMFSYAMDEATDGNCAVWLDRTWRVVKALSHKEEGKIGLRLADGRVAVVSVNEVLDVVWGDESNDFTPTTLESLQSEYRALQEFNSYLVQGVNMAVADCGLPDDTTLIECVQFLASERRRQAEVIAKLTTRIDQCGDQIDIMGHQLRKANGRVNFWKEATENRHYQADMFAADAARIMELLDENDIEPTDESNFRRVEALIKTKKPLVVNMVGEATFDTRDQQQPEIVSVN